MIPTQKMKLLSKQICFIVSIYTISFIFNNYSQEKINPFYAFRLSIPVLLVFYFIPLVLAPILSTKYARPAAILMLSILSATIFGNIVNRFTAFPIIATQDSALIWKIFYEGTFGIILIFAVIACWLTFKLLQEVHRPTVLPEPDSSKAIAKKTIKKQKKSSKKAAKKNKKH